MNLKDALQGHVEIGFPSFPEDDDFSNWVGELVLMDGYYAGLAYSYLDGSNKSIDFEYLSEMKMSLEKFEHIDEDSDIYIECLNYLKSIERITLAISELMI